MEFKKAYVPLRERTRTAGRLLDLFAEEIRDAGAVEVAQALIDKVNPVVARIDVSRNDIDDPGMIALARAVEVSTSLMYVYLYGNSFQDAGSIAMADALRINSTVRALDMSQNRVGVAGGAALGGALRANNALREINVSFAHMGAGGVAALAAGLAVNNSVTLLNIGTNDMGDDGAVALAAAVRSNNSLISVSVINNNIGDIGAAAFADALRFKATGSLTSLDLNRNVIADAGATALCSALQVNGTLTELLLDYNEKILESGCKALKEALSINIVLRNFSGPGGPLPSMESRRAARPAFLENHCRLLLVDLHAKEGALEVSLGDLADKKHRLHDATLMLRQITDDLDLLSRDPCCLSGCTCRCQERYQLADHLPVCQIPGHLSSVAQAGDGPVTTERTPAGLNVGVVGTVAPAQHAPPATPAHGGSAGSSMTSTPMLSPGAPKSRAAAANKFLQPSKGSGIDVFSPPPPPPPPEVSAAPEAHRIVTSAAATTLISFRALMSQYANRVMNALNSVYVPSLFGATPNAAAAPSSDQPLMSASSNASTSAGKFSTTMATPAAAPEAGSAGLTVTNHSTYINTSATVTPTTTITTITTITSSTAGAPSMRALPAKIPTFSFATPLRPYAWWGTKTINECVQRLTKLSTQFDFTGLTLADFQPRATLGRKFIPAATSNSHTRMHGGQAVVFYSAVQQSPVGAAAVWPMTLRVDYNFEQTDPTAQALSQSRFENGVRINTASSTLPFHPNVLRNLHFFSDKFVDWAHLPENRDVNQFVNIHKAMTLLPSTQLSMHFTIAPSPQFTLRTLIAQRPLNTPFAETEVLHLATFMGAGLSHLHNHQVVHRDLRPECVWLFWPPSESERDQDAAALDLAVSNAERAEQAAAARAAASLASPTAGAAARRPIGGSVSFGSPVASSSVVKNASGGNAVATVVAVAGGSQTIAQREQQLWAEYAPRIMECQPVIAELNEHRDFSKAQPAMRESMCVPYTSKNTGVSRGGHPAYLPPEIVQTAPSDYAVLNYSRSDSWGFGVLLYQLMHQSTEKFPYPDTAGIGLASKEKEPKNADASAEPSDTPDGTGTVVPMTPPRTPSTPKLYPSTPMGSQTPFGPVTATSVIPSLTIQDLPSHYSPRLREITCGLLHREISKRWQIPQAFQALQSALDNMCTECGHQHSSIAFQP